MAPDFIRHSIRASFLRLGWDVARVRSRQSEKREQWRRQELANWRVMSHYRPHTVLDIGANAGQFARLTRDLLPDARIISFEPLAAPRRELLACRDELGCMDVLPLALGDRDGQASMNRNAFTPSSSLLDLEPLHAEVLPCTADTVPETVEVRRLDGLRESLRLLTPVFVKIDVQGYTQPVLAGGEQTIKDSAAVVAEVSVAPLYRGETNFHELYETLRGWGFEYRGNVDQWRRAQDGTVLQCDCLFENTRLCRDATSLNASGAVEEESALVDADTPDAQINGYVEP